MVLKGTTPTLSNPTSLNTLDNNMTTNTHLHKYSDTSQYMSYDHPHHLENSESDSKLTFFNQQKKKKKKQTHTHNTLRSLYQ